MARSRFTVRLAAAIVVPAVTIAMLAVPAIGKKTDPTAEAGETPAAVDPNAGVIPTPVPPATDAVPTPGAGTDSGAGLPGFPDFGPPDEVGVLVQPERLVQLVQQCDSIAVAGLAVAAHECENGIDVSGTLPPGAPWTVFVASNDTYLMVAPTVASGKKAEIRLPVAAEPLRKWVLEETGIRLRRAR